ncbi:VCBS repeat-containing protein, partial [Akkermansiaceae bacterium]|nr:VCBS repeat-containing protein [Akkermansiaceae bacterium]
DFGPQRIITSSATEVIDAFPADMDGDGDIDVLAAKPGSPFGGGSIVIYRNNGNGSFTELNNRFPGSSAALVSNVVGSDLDNDGDIDVVVGSSGFSSGGVRVYRNNGNLSFTRTFDNGNAPGLWDIHLADLNGDNRPEIMFSLGGSFDQIGVYVNSGNLSSWGNLIPVKSGTNTGDEPRSIHAADIDGDGDVDVMSVNYLSNQLSYYPNGGPQQVRHVTSASQTRGPRNLRTGDINGDGVLDMISTSVLDGKVAWYRGTGRGNFASQQIIHRYQTGANEQGPRGLDVVDMDGDGDLDVLSTSEVGSSVCFHENTGSGSFSQPVIITNRANGVNLVTTIDMDGDGDLDVVSASPGDNKIAWYEQLGGGAKDSDGDGVNDDEDAFPNDPKETADTDNDGVGDNADVFPNDPTEIADCDNDGVGDNADARSPQIIAGLEAQIAQLQAQITELSKRPTLEQIQDARLNSIVMSAGQNNTATLKFYIEESADLKTWTNQGKSVEAGFPLEAGKKFLRFSLEKE